MPLPNRIRELRLKRDWTLEVLAAKVDSTPIQVSRLERGERQLTQKWMDRLASALGCSPVDLLPDQTMPQRTVPVVGYVGAEDLYYPDPEFGPWGEFNEIEAPPGYDSLVAVEVRGRSLEPMYRSGDTIFFRKPPYGPPERYVGYECLVQIRNGPACIKSLKKGTTNGLFDLSSLRESPMKDVAVEWASPVLWVKRAVI